MSLDFTPHKLGRDPQDPQKWTIVDANDFIKLEAAGYKSVFYVIRDNQYYLDNKEVAPLDLVIQMGLPTPKAIDAERKRLLEEAFENKTLLSMEEVIRKTLPTSAQPAPAIKQLLEEEVPNAQRRFARDLASGVK